MLTVVVEPVALEVDVDQSHVLKEDLADLLDDRDLLGFTELVVREV